MTAQKASIAFSGNIPVNYESFLGPLFFEPYATLLAERLRTLKPVSLLEVACGTGRVTKHLPAVLPENANIVATDVNPAMLLHAKETVGEHPNIRWDIVDAVTLPYSDASFDSIISQFGVMFYSDRPKAYAEALRVLKPGGVFVFITWDELRNNPVAYLTNETLAEFFPRETPAFYQVPFSYHDVNCMRSDLASTGFSDISIETLSLTGYAKTAETAAKGLIEGTPVFTAIEERDARLLPEIQQTLAQKLTLRFGSSNLNAPLNAHLVIAKK